MDVRQQEYFVAIAEEKSLSKAAARLFVSQPTLSQFLFRLEKEMDTELVRRNKGGVLSLTESGQLFYESSLKILRIRDDFEIKFQKLKDSLAGELVVSTNISIGAFLFGRALARLQRQYPDAGIQIQYKGFHTMAENLRNGTLDVGLVCYTAPKLTGYEYIPLPPIEYLLILPKGHPLSAKGSPSLTGEMPRVSLKMFSNEKVISVVDSSFLKAYCGRQNIVLTGGITVYNDTSFAQRAVESGLGIGVYSKIPIASGEEKNIRYFKLDPPLFSNVGIYYNPQSCRHPAFAEYIRILREDASKLQWDSLLDSIE